jgi:hypothetical protein
MFLLMLIGKFGSVGYVEIMVFERIVGIMLSLLEK